MSIAFRLVSYRYSQLGRIIRATSRNTKLPYDGHTVSVHRPHRSGGLLTETNASERVVVFSYLTAVLGCGFGPDDFSALRMRL
jgi:hypothetical protein